MLSLFSARVATGTIFHRKNGDLAFCSRTLFLSFFVASTCPITGSLGLRRYERDLRERETRSELSLQFVCAFLLISFRHMYNRHTVIIGPWSVLYRRIVPSSRPANLGASHLLGRIRRVRLVLKFRGCFALFPAACRTRINFVVFFIVGDLMTTDQKVCPRFPCFMCSGRLRPPSCTNWRHELAGLEVRCLIDLAMIPVLIFSLQTHTVNYSSPIDLASSTLFLSALVRGYFRCNLCFISVAGLTFISFAGQHASQEFHSGVCISMFMWSMRY
jgi:hypothetical protein